MKLFFLPLAGLTLFATAGLAQVSVTATAGTTGPTAYTTVKGAFDAINAGTHRGAITISITGDTTETATAALNASGSGAAAYTSVLVRPTGGTRTITGNIVGAIIKLNGADNVTIDGRINGAGRNLTVSNSNGIRRRPRFGWPVSRQAMAPAITSFATSKSLAARINRQSSIRPLASSRPARPSARGVRMETTTTTTRLSPTASSGRVTASSREASPPITTSLP